MQLNGYKMALSVAINGNHIMEEQCWIFVVLQRRHKGSTSLQLQGSGATVVKMNGRPHSGNTLLLPYLLYSVLDRYH